MTVYLVRHAEVELRADVSAPAWELTPAGRAAAARLADAPLWREVERVATSPEPKALETARPLARAAGVPLVEEPDLREVARAGTPILAAADYRALVGRYLSGEQVAGWEPAERARSRIETCIARLVAEGRGPLAIVSHGLVLSLYLALTPAEWEAIPLPAVAVADPLRRTLLRPWTGIEAPFST